MRTAPGESRRNVGRRPDHLGEQSQGLQVELGPEDLDRRGVGDVEVTLGRGPGDLPVDQPQELELGVDLRQVDPHPFLVDHSPAVGELVFFAHSRVSPSARSMIPGEQSVTRSWLSWLVISDQPLFSPPTTLDSGTRTSSQ